MSKPLRQLIVLIAFDIPFSLILSLVVSSLAGLQLIELAIVFCLTIFIFGVVAVEIISVFVDGESLPYSVLVAAGMCLILVTIGPFSYVPGRLRYAAVRAVAALTSQDPFALQTTQAQDVSGNHLEPEVATRTGVAVEPTAKSSLSHDSGAEMTPEESAGSRSTSRPSDSAPPATAQPVCPLEPVGEFGRIGTEAHLGCPIEAEHSIWSARQQFESGLMFWRGDGGGIYVLFYTGVWERFKDEWFAGMPADDPSISPPSDRFQPIHGFGKIWRDNNIVRDGLGWATAPEQGLCVTLQEFASGDIIIRYRLAEQGCSASAGYAAPDLAFVYLLHRNGNWQQY